MDDLWPGLGCVAVDAELQNLARKKITRAVVWLRFLELPIARYHPRILAALVNIVGTLVKIDEATLMIHRGKYARIAVEVDMSKPLRSTVDLDGEMLRVAYEGLPTMCFTCGMVGHADVACPHRPPASTVSPSPCDGEDGRMNGRQLTAVSVGKQPQLPPQMAMGRGH
ncbi:hypothetical protein K2173_012687 [Erythroxylum novogranatense]|uniref:Zinc knuckle CX2CX4HX4C domain-containing protein n=1 Tax=Erythroxylum novogranatense TaxID=1862640 RepID=A0AAV8TJM3_9ROSI|nr:hypothetical protein K2173_012687 [Erythroxylum novogranatense]